MEHSPALLIACDIDGTLVRTGRPVSAVVRDAATVVRAAGHHIVLATGRSLAGALPIALQLGLDDAWLTASNGAVTAHLRGHHYQITEQHDVDAEAVVRVAATAAPGVRIAAEDVGTGYRVNVRFPERELNGTQTRVAELEELWSSPTPRIALNVPEAYRLMWPLRSLGLTAILTRPDWVDVTAPAISKATALEKVRSQLGVELLDTVAIGDSENDVEMLTWAARAFVMASAPAFVIAAGNHVTGTVDQDGAASALLSLLG